MTSHLIHLDTDIGGDIDDLCALAMVLGWPGAELVGLTTNSDDGGKRAGYARFALDLAGHHEVPVAAGADVAGGHYSTFPGLPDESAYWPEPVPPLPDDVESALDLLETNIERGATFIAIGPCTNLALLDRRSPGLLATAHIVLMGGYVYPIRPGYPAWGNTMDWNFQVDATSALSVLEHSTPLLVPLTVTVETALRRSHLPALQSGGPLARLIARQAVPFALENGNEATYGASCAGLPADIINFLHDPLACAIALGWDAGVRIEEVPLRFGMADGELYERVDAAGKPTRLVTAIDGQAFNQHWLALTARV